MMKKWGILLLVVLLPTISHAKRCGNGYIADHKTCHKDTPSYSGSSGGSYRSTTYGGYYDNVSTTPKPPPKPLPIQHGITVRKAGVRTCEFEECTVVRYLPKDEKISWQISTDKFIKIHGVNAWIKKDDIKKTK